MSFYLYQCSKCSYTTHITGKKSADNKRLNMVNETLYKEGKSETNVKKIIPYSDIIYLNNGENIPTYLSKNN